MCNQTLFVPSENMTISMGYFQIQSPLVVIFELHNIPNLLSNKKLPR